MKVKSVRTELFKLGDNLISLITQNVKKVKEGSVVAITSKVVSLSEGRWIEKKDGVTLETLVRKEAFKVWESRHCFLTLKDGILAPNAGVDESNAFGGFILWPKDSFLASQRIHRALHRHYRVKRLGVLITDSWPMPLRHGVIGIALGYYGFEGQKNYIGKKDLAGRKLKMTRVSVADCLASAAVLAMGEGSEQTPIAVIEDAPVVFTKRNEKGKLKIAPKDDVYRPVMKIG